jgi:hypothetical protein
VLQANGTAERDAALVMMEAIPGDHQVTVGADKVKSIRQSFVSMPTAGHARVDS